MQQPYDNVDARFYSENPYARQMDYDAMKEEQNYRPEEYDEYPDFPTSMLRDHNYHQPQTF